MGFGSNVQRDGANREGFLCNYANNSFKNPQISKQSF